MSQFSWLVVSIVAFLLGLGLGILLVTIQDQKVQEEEDDL